MYFSVAGLRRAALTCLAGLALTSPVVAHDDVLCESLFLLLVIDYAPAETARKEIGVHTGLRIRM